MAITQKLQTKLSQKLILTPSLETVSVYSAAGHPHSDDTAHVLVYRTTGADKGATKTQSQR